MKNANDEKRRKKKERNTKKSHALKLTIAKNEIIIGE